MTTNRPEKLDEALIRPGRVDHQVAFGNATQTQIKQLFERMYTNDLPRTKFIKSLSSSSTLNSTSGTANGKLSTIKEKKPLTPPITPITASHEHTNSQASTPTFNGYAKIGSRIANGEIVIGEKDNGGVGEEELKEIARDFSLKVPDDMFSPAEIQGFLLKRKKDPRKALDEVEAWVEGMVDIKKKGTKLVRVQ
jgi:chaperone BCS1